LSNVEASVNSATQAKEQFAIGFSSVRKTFQRIKKSLEMQRASLGTVGDHETVKVL
jgi:hypothetical protein